MSGNKLFDKIASEILASSKKNSDSCPCVGEQLYESFVSMLKQEFKEIEEIEKKFVKAFYKGERNILSIEQQTSAIKITLNAKIGMLRDDKKLLRDVSNIGHWGNGDYQVRIKKENCFKDILNLIKQIY